MMRSRSFRVFSYLVAVALPAAAENPMAAPMAPASGSAAASLAAPASSTPSPRPVAAVAPVAGDIASHEPQLSEAEQRIRQGIVLLGSLHDLLAKIKDEATAEAAVPAIMRASAEFQSWAQGFSSLPPLDADTQRHYERRYLPIIDELNTRIRIQGERIASAEFYGSQNLPAALVRLVTSMQ